MRLVVVGRYSKRPDNRPGMTQGDGGQMLRHAMTQVRMAALARWPSAQGARGDPLRHPGHIRTPAEIHSYSSALSFLSCTLRRISLRKHSHVVCSDLQLLCQLGTPALSHKAQSQEVSRERCPLGGLPASPPPRVLPCDGPCYIKFPGRNTGQRSGQSGNPPPPPSQDEWPQRAHPRSLPTPGQTPVPIFLTGRSLTILEPFLLSEGNQVGTDPPERKAH